MFTYQLEEAIKNGDVTLIEHIIEEADPFLTSSVDDVLAALITACTRDNVQITKRFYDLLPENVDITRCFIEAARIGKKEIIDVLLSESTKAAFCTGPQYQVSPACVLASGGFLEALQSLPVDPMCLLTAANNGHDSVVKYMIDVGATDYIDLALSLAIDQDRPNVVQVINNFLNPPE